MFKFPASHWRILPRNEHNTPRVQCLLCPHECILDDGERGICFGRMNRDGRLVLDIAGRISGLAVDPIEKKPLYHFHPGSDVLSFGTIGCNLACAFCQNYEISAQPNIHRLSETVEPEHIAATAMRAGCASVAFTYNEPAIFMEYAIETARACHEAGLLTVAVTSGYFNKEPRREFFSHIDAVNIDIKSFSQDFYSRLCGARLDVVLDAIRHVAHETSAWLELTTLLIPGENDSEKEIHNLCAWIVDNAGPETPLHFSAFHPAWKMMNTPTTPFTTLVTACDIARSHGIAHVYTGNVRDIPGSTTRCLGCGRDLVTRSGFTVLRNSLVGGRCPDCGVACAGRWNA